MTDPLGLIGQSNQVGRETPAGPQKRAAEDLPSFKDTLQDQIDRVNELQQDAKEAMEDLAAGRRDDVETVMIATQKADTAFRLLLQVRNKVMDAYEEIKQVRI